MTSLSSIALYTLLLRCSEVEGQADNLELLRVKCPWYASAGIAVWMIEAKLPLWGRFTNHKGHPAEKAVIDLECKANQSGGSSFESKYCEAKQY